MARARSTRFPVRYLRNQPRLRPRGNFTRCFDEARGEFVKYLCDDDLLAPTCVASLLDAFRHAPDITLATSRRRRIDAHGHALADQPATTPIVAADADRRADARQRDAHGGPQYRRRAQHGDVPQGRVAGSGAGVLSLRPARTATVSSTWSPGPRCCSRATLSIAARRCLHFASTRGSVSTIPRRSHAMSPASGSCSRRGSPLQLHRRLPPDELWVKPFPLAGEVRLARAAGTRIRGAADRHALGHGSPNRSRPCDPAARRPCGPCSSSSLRSLQLVVPASLQLVVPAIPKLVVPAIPAARRPGDPPQLVVPAISAARRPRDLCSSSSPRSSEDRHPRESGDPVSLAAN